MILATYPVEPAFQPSKLGVAAQRVFLSDFGLWIDYIDEVPTVAEVQLHVAWPLQVVSQVWVRNDPPDDSLGADGDQWYNQITGDLWQKQNGTFY